MDYIHPKAVVKTADSQCVGRSYCKRSSTSKEVDGEKAEECTGILANALALKQSAICGLPPPQVGVKCTIRKCFKQTYVDCYSTPQLADERAPSSS